MLISIFAAALLAQTPIPPAVDERVVVTATAAPAGAMSLGRAVQVLTRDVIARFAGGSVADALRLAAGVDVRARGERGIQADFVLRGASFGHTLVLIDGLRLNDAQSGHHNADFPLSSASIERIEVVTGAASSAHGADAFGGAIHIVTRTDPHIDVSAAAGSFASGRAEASAGWTSLALTATAWGSRSDGFMFDRDHAMGGARAALSPFAGARVSAGHGSKAFGANGFYGPSPSKEWTDQTRVSASAGRTGSVWTADARAAYRKHGDRFRWDIARPGFAENTHATRAGAFVEVQLPLVSGLVIQPAMRADTYSTFGSASSPSLAVSWRTAHGWRARGSAGRAFRVPTYTERYYTDPNHTARHGLDPEDGWTVDAGLDWRGGGWAASATAFGRWDSDVIDWVRATPAERW